MVLEDDAITAISRIKGRPRLASLKTVAMLAGKKLGQAIVGRGGLQREPILVLTSAEDADGFTQGVCAALARAGHKTHIWCMWTREIELGFGNFPRLAEVFGEYRDELDDSYQLAIVSRSFVTNPAVLRALLSKLEHDGRKISEVIVATASLGLGQDEEMSTIIPYMRSKSSFLTGVLDPSNLVREEIGDDLHQALDLNMADLIIDTPRLVQRHTATAKTFGM
ncbi:hypothetical protein [Devosia sp. LjRoot3]|uniref:hypothetical protein n=1 Tax=Devosia sp. LjRoot3 TaxID=3342319 RepID=UPI003ECC2929